MSPVERLSTGQVQVVLFDLDGKSMDHLDPDLTMPSLTVVGQTLDVMRSGFARLKDEQ